MKIFIAPLNWGLGHATRCVPLIDRFLAQGHEVVLGGDGLSLQYLRQRYPHLRSIELAPLNLRYSSGKRQVFAMLVAIPKLIRFSLRDHRLLKRIQAQESFDEIISDNRFGLWLPLNSTLSTLNYRCVYLTHQLHILFPRPYRWLEPLAARLHAWVYKHYTEVWIPDTPDHRLSGNLSTLNSKLPPLGTLSECADAPLNSKLSTLNLKYVGPLSRFTTLNSKLPPLGTLSECADAPLNSKLSTLNSKKTVALFSGLEPHRTLFEQAILERYRGHEEDVLLVNGKLDKQLSDSELAYYLTHAEKIIARSGYSTIMDLDALGVLDKAELIPTPGQPEQEYLASKPLSPTVTRQSPDSHPTVARQ
ncbi:MAG: hypothetical protein MJZ84_00940 [Paludibacteraceae bacterium]|nr:hypothetical protein [Paludibacteraceae bacterium]